MKYISLGGNCSVTYQLKKFNLKKESYPFDWSKITINQLIIVLENNFFDYHTTIEIKKMSLQHLDKDNFINSTYLLNNKYNIGFAHELINLNQIDDFKEKIKRRIERFCNINDNVIFIRIELSKLSDSYKFKIIKLCDLLKKYVNDFKLIIIINKQYNFKIDIPNIIIYYYDDFYDNWQMNNIQWQKIFTI